ncbi:MAG: type III pantothenate kinase [Planctomycetes bacterium]|nr:type III pantothenate kinase [Planctomycetota bacterium]
MNAARVLTVDRGNTTLDCRLGSGGSAVRDRLEPTERALVEFVGSRPLDVVVAASVVDRGDDELASFCRQRGIPLLRAGVELPCPFPTGYRDVAELGVDRWVGAFAAREVHGPCVVVDAGTAVTVDAIDGDRFFAGVIAPGLATASAGLVQRAPRLPLADLDAGSVELPSASPTQSVTAGALLGFAAMVDGLVSRVRAAARIASGIVVLTGGDADRIVRHSETAFEHEPDLVHAGLTWLFQRRDSSS